MIAWIDVVNIAPELASLTEPTQTSILAYVNRKISSDTWGDDVGIGAAYLAAHLGTLARRRGEAPTSSQTVGQLTQAFTSQLALAGLYSTTAYGVEFASLSRTLPTVLGLVGC